MQLAKLSPNDIVSIFIGDCIIADKHNTLRAADIYEIFVAYCDQLDIAVPCGVSHFGACLNKRFQSKRVKGYTKYFCDYKPGLFDVK